MALERYEKMFKENYFPFKSEVEIAVFELHYPDVFKSESEASKAAVKFFEAALEDEKNKLEAANKLNDSKNMDEIKSKIALINSWFAEHPEIRGLMAPQNVRGFYSLEEVEKFELDKPDEFDTNPDVKKAARECIDFRLTHAKGLLEDIKCENRRSSPKFVEIISKRIAKLEQWIERHPEI